MRTRKFTPAYAQQQNQPLVAMNMTPLIDVLLVLIVMMILTVPIVTHKVPIDLPQPGPSAGPHIVHRVDLGADGGLAWDGVAIADASLPARLAAMQGEPNADLQIAANAEARYERFDQTLATIKQAGVSRLGFVGNDRFARFDAR